MAEDSLTFAEVAGSVNSLVLDLPESGHYLHTNAQKLIFPFSFESRHSVTPSHMEYWKSSWFSFPKARIDGI